MSRITKTLILGTVIAAFASGIALADRKPTLEERAKIETKLKESGFTSWDEIEFDEKRNQWEIDDARAGI